MSFLINQYTLGDTTSDGKQAFLIVGDSIFAGLNAHVASDLPSPGTAYEFDRNTDTIIPFGDGAGIAGFSFNSKSPWAKFCIDYHNDTGYKPVIINRAASSSTASTASDNNDWQTTGNNFDAAINSAQECLTQLGITKLKGIFINLGINDVQGLSGTGSFTAAQVSAFIGTIISNLIANFGSDVPILYMQIGQTASIQISSRLSATRNNIRTHCINNSNVNIAASLSAFVVAGLYEDGIHPNKDGNDALGSMFARWFRNSSYTKWARSIISCHFDDILTANKVKINDWMLVWQTQYMAMDWFFNFKTTLRNNAAFDWAFLCGPEIDGGFAFTANDSIRTSSNSLFNIGYDQLLSIVNMSQNDNGYELKIKTNHTGQGIDGIAFGVSNAATTLNTYLRQTTTPQIGWASNQGTTVETYNGHLSLIPASWYMRRSGASAQALFVDGSSVDTGTSTTQVLQSYRVHLGARNLNGSPSSNIDLSLERFIGIKQSVVSDVSSFIAALNVLQA